jgi:DNA-directed RNA polymerase specialized sigma24 family protein
VPSNAAPPLNEDFRLVEGLRGQRPGAVGHVYNVYGPELVEYAEGLLGDHGRAVQAVRAALLALRDKGADVPDAGTFRDWLYEVVRDECRRPARGRRRIAVIGAATAAVLAAGLVVAFESGGDAKPEPARPQAAPATPEASPPPVTVSPAQKDGQKKKDEKKEKPAAGKPAKRRPSGGSGGGAGRLAVSDGGCHGLGVAGLPRSCPVRLTAVGGTVRWAVASVRSRGGRVSASGGGTLKAGRSATVTVVVRPTVLCYIGGGGGGSVSFSPGGTATVSYTCWRR